MYTSTDFERLFIRYKAEAVPAGESIQSFCDRNKVPFNLFNKWYKDTRHKVVPIQVLNGPVPENEEESSDSPKSEILERQAGVRILLDLRMSNGMHIRQGNLSYDKLRRLVEKLEALC